VLAGALPLAVPWWAHRRRRAKVKVDRTLAAWPEIASAVGLPGSRVMSALVDTWGWRARFALARGQTINDVIGKIPALESGLGTFRGAVRVQPTLDDLANRFELRVLDKDPHADAIAWPGMPASSITEPVDLGPFEDATPARVLFLRRHVLVGGVSGSGKSGGLNVIMASLSACADVVIWAIDLKRGMELRPCPAEVALRLRVSAKSGTSGGGAGGRAVRPLWPHAGRAGRCAACHPRSWRSWARRWTAARRPGAGMRTSGGPWPGSRR